MKKFNYYFEKKSNILIFFLLVLGVSIPVFSGIATNNFWYRLNFILLNPFFNAMLSISIGLNVIYFYSELSSYHSIISRYDNYKNLIKKFTKDIVYVNLIVYFVAIILGVSGAIFFCLGDFKMLLHSYYELPIIGYIIFHIIKCCIICVLVNLIIYLFLQTFRKRITYIIIFILSFLFLILPINQSIIQHFYNMPILYHNYFFGITFSTFFLEIICSILEILILCTLYKIMYEICISKKRELV